MLNIKVYILFISNKKTATAVFLLKQIVIIQIIKNKYFLN